MTSNTWPEPDLTTSPPPAEVREPVVVADAVESLVAPVRHEVQVKDGRFALAVCTCGWHGIGRRLRATARAEAHDHALLYADGSSLSTGDSAAET